MKYIVRIDKSSIKKNPDAGQTTFMVPGAWHPDGKGGGTRSVQMMQQMTPDPNYLFEREYCEVTCMHCNTKFSHKDLEEHKEWDYEEDGCYWVDNVCPNCKEADCCELEYEQFDQETGLVKGEKNE